VKNLILTAIQLFSIVTAIFLKTVSALGTSARNPDCSVKMMAFQRLRSWSQQTLAVRFEFENARYTLPEKMIIHY